MENTVNIRKNVVTQPFTFVIRYYNGMREERTVEAESVNAAYLTLKAELWEDDAEITLKSERQEKRNKKK